jgi:hypothetical protein
MDDFDFLSFDCLPFLSRFLARVNNRLFYDEPWRSSSIEVNQRFANGTRSLREISV